MKYKNILLSVLGLLFIGISQWLPGQQVIMGFAGGLFVVYGLTK